MKSVYEQPKEEEVEAEPMQVDEELLDELIGKKTPSNSPKSDDEERFVAEEVDVEKVSIYLQKLMKELDMDEIDFEEKNGKKN